MSDNGVESIPDFIVPGELLQAALNCIAAAAHPNMSYVQVSEIVQRLSQCEPVPEGEPDAVSE